MHLNETKLTKKHMDWFLIPSLYSTFSTKEKNKKLWCTGRALIRCDAFPCQALVHYHMHWEHLYVHPRPVGPFVLICCHCLLVSSISPDTKLMEYHLD